MKIYHNGRCYKKTMEEAIVETICCGWSEMEDWYAKQGEYETDEAKAKACNAVALGYKAMKCQLCREGRVKEGLWYMFTTSKDNYYRLFPAEKQTTPSKNPCSANELKTLSALFSRVLLPLMSEKQRAAIGCTKEEAEEMYKALMGFLAEQTDIASLEGFMVVD